ncbi:MAG: glycoside hydrolase family 9 protein [Bacteroidetes bacterium]|nr:glycoside hydrolase family 9 protein [Bacteroidota bacterium]
MKIRIAFVGLLCSLSLVALASDSSWIRINQLGYTIHGKKQAVWCSKDKTAPMRFEIIHQLTGRKVYQGKADTSFGAYGPFKRTARIDFSAVQIPGKYYIQSGNSRSPVFSISDTVYNGAADFCLQYMRQQRSGFNSYLKDSCHTHDGYTLYGPMPDSTHIDATGGWHDASDYLQYSATTANATWQLLAAYRDFPGVFGDRHQRNGLSSSNGLVDVLDEARWGIDWLLKMHPRPDWLFNQLGDDRDHVNMRIPKEDPYYGKGFERPVYFVNGKPQQRGKFMNQTTGAASTAGKFASAFALGSELFEKTDLAFANLLFKKAQSAWELGLNKPGYTQTVSVRSPYIYAEENWTDDMELAGAALFGLSGKRDSIIREKSMRWAEQEPITPWMIRDTANHYQWYPFINEGHGEWARILSGASREKMVDYYRQGMEVIRQRARGNAFLRGIPFIWCSNNLTVQFAIQCRWYRQLSGDSSFQDLEQANIDWLFGCNPWGTSMVYGLPEKGDTPVDPHSAFTHLKNYPINGGLIDGPVYTSIYKNLIGIQLMEPDEYAPFQSDLAVYHDDYGDYSTNEPTMDGTASLIYLLAALQAESNHTTAADYTLQQGAVVRGSIQKKEIALVFTGDEFGEGLGTIRETLQKEKVPAAFYFTGRFYRNASFANEIKGLYHDGHLLGPHSDQHLLYCDWKKRDSTLVSRDSLLQDLKNNLSAMRALGISDDGFSGLYIPPYEWWNREVAGWLAEEGIRLFSCTAGLGTPADYTYPEMGAAYKSNDQILQLLNKASNEQQIGLNGSILLIHAGADTRRKEKLFTQLESIIKKYSQQGYQFVRIDQLIK